MTSSSQLPTRTTAAFFVQAAVAFGVAVVAMGTGIAYLPVDHWVRAFLGVGALFLVSSCFTLAKCVRDQQEDATVRAMVDEARRDGLMAGHDPFRVS